MTRWILRLLSCWVAVLLVLFARIERAEASAFQVSPVRLPLSASATSGVLTIANHGTEPVRLQLDAFGWKESTAGEMQLSPTQDLVVFPTMLTIPAGDTRKVRVAAATAFATSEKNYRVFVEELPPPVKASVPGVIKVLTRMGIPVFLVPTSPVATPKVAATVANDHIDVSVSNAGTLHFMVRRIRVVAKDASGKVLWERSTPGWYVLAGAMRTHVLPRPSQSCASIARLVVEVQTDHGDISTTLGQPKCP